MLQERSIRNDTILDDNDEPLREMCIDYRGASPARAEACFQRIVMFFRIYAGVVDKSSTTIEFDKCDDGYPCSQVTTGCRNGHCVRRLHPLVKRT